MKVDVKFGFVRNRLGVLELKVQDLNPMTASTDLRKISFLDLKRDWVLAELRKLKPLQGALEDARQAVLQNPKMPPTKAISKTMGIQEQSARNYLCKLYKVIRGNQ